MLSVKEIDPLIIEYYANIERLNKQGESKKQPKRNIKRKYNKLTNTIETIGIILFFILISVNG